MPRSLSVILALFGVILGLADSSARAVELAQSPQMGQIIDAAPMIFAGDWQGDDHAAVRLLAVDNGAEGAGGIHALNPIKLSEAQKWLGLEFRLAAGWHIYGRDPGDAGLPPIMQFLTAPESKLLNKLLNKSENKSAATAPPGQAKRTDNSSELGFTSRILWPQDKKLEILGILSRGYDQSVILPILLTDLSPKTAQISLQNRPIYYADVPY
ncbi:MAG: protein-disulfide reductase DsbD family protein, partial [Alphaproteobacteria bacterium]|nr:protein-disulfide reductase DsbD family protein [Alphaproteobacteria bacterium]